MNRKKLSGRLSVGEQIMFAKRLAVLMKADVSIVSALHMLQSQSSSKTASRIFEQMKSSVEHGQSLADSMAKFKKIFNNFSISIVRVGELSGTLHENLNYLADELKKKQELQRKIISAAIYPLFIVVATIGIAILLTVYVFPKIIPVFTSFNFTLPWSTRVLIGASYTMQHYWLFIIITVLLSCMTVALLLRNQRVHLWYDKNIIRIPLIGRLIRSYHIANCSRTLGLLLKSDIRLVDSLQIVANTMSNRAYQKKFVIIAEQAAQGEKISELFLEDTLLFPSVVSQMVSVGETTGNLSSSLLYVAEIHEEELNSLTKNLSTSIEPLLMIFMGVIVGFIAISIITPVYAITQHLRK